MKEDAGIRTPYGTIPMDDIMRLMEPVIEKQREIERLRMIINKAMQQHTVLEMRGQLFESQCIDRDLQIESGHWESEEE